MKVLIVDDEVIVVQGIVNSVPWDTLMVERVLTANSFAQAVEVMQAHPVDILLCDIEMPGGNGLDLIEWTNEHYPDIVSVILSCHGEFHFAQQAVRLRALEYALKPVEPEALTQLLQRAILKKLEQTQDVRYREYGKVYIRQIASESESSEVTAARSIENVKAYIAAHIEDELSVASLAERFHFSPDYFSRAFKKETGKSLIDYIGECRVNLAAQLLRDTDIPLTLIADRVGFESQSYFIRRFRQYYEMSPKEYRVLRRERK